ncbi:MAG: GGDEF domain-containing protein [Myxococcales bacterium]|nr:GGDEF domain-containing protein [Myxococcales bacterium]
MGKDSTVVTVIREDGPVAEVGDACLVVINGADLGKRYPLTRLSTVIGRSSKTDVQIEEDAISRNHAMIVNRGDRYLLKDLGSTNGTYVNDRPVEELDLRDGDLIKIGRTIFKFLSGSNIESAYHEEIYRLTTTDGLTQIFNKRYFVENLEREMSRSLRYERNLSLVLFDIDHFKKTNDTYGHLTGDAVLKQVAQRILTIIRRDDIFARIGGEEFAVLTPEVNKDGAMHLAEKIRTCVEEAPCTFDGVDVNITVSLGVADLKDYVKEYHGGEIPSNFDCLELIALADKRLYKAKNSGRNRVVG